MTLRNNKITNQEIGQRVRQAREELGMTQTELAKAVGMSPNTVNRWESGQRSIVINDLTTVAAALSKPVIYFLTRDPYQPPDNWEDYPIELQQAMAYTGQIDPAHRPFIYKLWLLQAQAHAGIANTKVEVEKEVERLKNEIEALQREKGKITDETP